MSSSDSDPDQLRRESSQPSPALSGDTESAAQVDSGLVLPDLARHPSADPTLIAAQQIRSHVSVLAGYLSMLDEGAFGALPPAARSALAPMQAKVRAISRIVEDMLEDARS